jgi:redox-sensitive bicupin YhaK (pirin superfamily)
MVTFARMLTIRRSLERGRSDHGWLDSRHTFSFADYHDPRFMGFRSLRVINEDRVVPGEGFGTHGHRDMEIISIVLEGAIAHKDSIGTGAVLTPGEVQRMTAGTGVQHSEFNASSTEPLHFLQIWILPSERGLAPGYEQRRFDPAAREGKLQLVASPDKAEGSLQIHQDARLYLTRLAPGQVVHHALAPGRGAWVQVISGTVTLNGKELQAGDGASVEKEAALSLTGSGEVLVFDLA